jgi:hypothetical protein
MKNLGGTKTFCLIFLGNSEDSKKIATRGRETPMAITLNISPLSGDIFMNAFQILI